MEVQKILFFLIDPITIKAGIIILLLFFIIRYKFRLIRINKILSILKMQPQEYFEAIRVFDKNLKFISANMEPVYQTLSNKVTELIVFYFRRYVLDSAQFHVVIFFGIIKKPEYLFISKSYVQSAVGDTLLKEEKFRAVLLQKTISHAHMFPLDEKIKFFKTIFMESCYVDTFLGREWKSFTEDVFYEMFSIHPETLERDYLENIQTSFREDFASIYTMVSKIEKKNDSTKKVLDRFRDLINFGKISMPAKAV